MKTLYLHIGTPKTGTTAIQVMCWNNEEALARKGYCYPHLPYEYDQVQIDRNGHFLVGRILNAAGDKRRVKKQNQIREEGVTTVLELFGKFDGVILSDENLWTFFAKYSVQKLQYLKDRCDEAGVELKVIVYLRAQHELITSWWKQQVKEINRQHSSDTIEGCYEGLKHAFSYYENVSKLAEVVGKENMIVRLFDRSAFENGTIQSDFFKCIGIDDISDFTVVEEEPNTSLKDNVIEILRILNSSSAVSEEYRQIEKQAARFASDNSNAAVKTTLFSDEEAAEFMKRFEEDNARLAREYFGREDGVLFRPQKGGVKWTVDNPYFHEDVINFFDYVHKCNFNKRHELFNYSEEQDARFRERVAKLEKRLNTLESSFPQKVSRKLNLNKIGQKKSPDKEQKNQAKQ